MFNALPLRYMSAFTKRSGKNVRYVRFTPPPPPRLLYEGKRLVCVCGGRRCRQAARECNGVWLGRMPARRTLYHTLVLVCGRASHIISDAPLSQGVSRIIGEICLTIGGFDQVDGFGLT